MHEKLVLEEQKTLVAAWPGPQDYNEAVQNPAQCFIDPELASGEPETNVLGLPKPTSGMFASVYKLQCSDAVWAVRCFLHSRSDQIDRYKQIQMTLRASNLDCLLPFEIQQEGIRVEHRTLPMLKMQWCEGESLNRWLQRNLKDKAAVEEFLEQWRSVVLDLSSAGIAHGDLQHGNIIIQNGKIKLVDYDCVFVPEFQGKDSNEIGHPNYQHPARNHRHFGPYLDNFSAWLIYISVLVAACDPHIWFDFEGGDECILFRKEDLDDPLQSELFHVLEHHFNPQIREASRTLRYLLSLPPDQIPGLDVSVTVPADLPDLDAIISDLPEWVTQDSASNSARSELEIPEGKRFLKRRRNRRAPLPPSMKEGSVSGCWSYDENGLVFNPETEAAVVASSTSLTMQSPIVYQSSQPVPYRRVGGTLASPMLDFKAESYDKSGNLASFSALRDHIPMIAAIWFLVCGAFAYFAPGIIDKAMWPDGEYYLLDEGLKAENMGKEGDAMQMFVRGLQDIKNSKDSRAEISRVHLLYNLGRLKAAARAFEEAEHDLSDSLIALQKTGDAGSSAEKGVILLELAKLHDQNFRLETAENYYKKAVESFVEAGLDYSDGSMQDALDRLLLVLKKEGKDKEKDQYESLKSIVGVNQ